MSSAKQILLDLLVPSSLHLPARYNYYKFKGYIDKEMLYVQEHLNTNHTFLDIGANAGIYSYHFRNKMKKIVAFEPVKEILISLENLKSRNIEIHNCALSNKNDYLEIHIPVDKYGNKISYTASLEARSENTVKRRIEVKKLDDFNYQDISLIKIDVEGHELEVLKGGYETIKKFKPPLVIEIEQRHLAYDMSKTLDYIKCIGYEIFFINNSDLCSISKFSYDKHQKPYLDNVMDKNYINNFVCMPI